MEQLAVYFLKKAVEVDMDSGAGCGVQENIFRMSITEAQDISHERHNCQCASKLCAALEPCRWSRKLIYKPFPQNRWISIAFRFDKYVLTSVKARWRIGLLEKVLLVSNLAQHEFRCTKD